MRRARAPVQAIHHGVRLLALAASLFASAASAAGDPSGLHLVWDAPSTNATGSMPLSGGNLGLNVWVEGDDLLFYIGHPDSRVEDQKLVKLGRVRLTMDPSPFRTTFRQELDLAQGCIRITAGDAAVTLWADAFASVVHVEIESPTPRSVSATFESWRFEARALTNGLEWVHRNDPSKVDRAAKMRAQQVEPLAALIPDPLSGLTMGGRLVAPGLVHAGSGTGVYMRTPFTSWKATTTSAVTRLDLRVLLRVEQDPSVDAWRRALDELERSPGDRKATQGWWRDFWERSWIDINPGAPPEDPGRQVGRNYQLFRYLLAANRTGRAPTLFNGGFFTFDNPLPDARAFDAAGPCPDERAWWGCHFMAQNQRWVYWPMIKAGDFDLLQVGLNFYRDRAALQDARSRHFFGVAGTPFCESLDLYGLQAACASRDGHMGCEHLRYHYTSALEFAFMMLESCRFQDREVAEYLPVLMGVLAFYDNFYQQECTRRTGRPLDAQGRLVIQPGNACEMGVGCRNHADAIAGLRAIATGLLERPGTDRAWLRGFLGRIPDLPLTERDGRRQIALAESWEKISNPNEFPQLYTLFPFHQYGVGLPDLGLALNTWKYGAFDPAAQKEALCWKYGNVAVAMLGRADEAQRYSLRKFLYPYGRDGSTVHYGSCARFIPRFPAFWATYPFDAFPDMDHGGTAMVGLQEMLLQTPGDRLLLLPAWPADWDVDFKLHAPRQTTVACSVRKGKITALTVSPPARRKDVEICGPVPPSPRPASQGRPATASSVWHQPGYEPARAVDGDSATRWAVANGQKSGWIEVDLGRTTRVARAVIQEIAWPSITRFAIEALRADGSWGCAATGTTIGAERELVFPPVAAQRFRLRIDEAGNMPNIEEFQLFEPPAPRIPGRPQEEGIP